jgi:hypothetical protein
MDTPKNTLDVNKFRPFGTYQSFGYNPHAIPERHCAPVAQRLEQQTHNLLVRGSNPCGGTKYLVSVLTFTPSEFFFASTSKPTMARRWRDSTGLPFAICIASLPLESNHFSRLALPKRSDGLARFGGV